MIWTSLLIEPSISPSKQTIMTSTGISRKSGRVRSHSLVTCRDNLYLNGQTHSTLHVFFDHTAFGQHSHLTLCYMVFHGWIHLISCRNNSYETSAAIAKFLYIIFYFSVLSMGLTCIDQWPRLWNWDWIIKNAMFPIQSSLMTKSPAVSPLICAIHNFVGGFVCGSCKCWLRGDGCIVSWDSALIID